MIKFQTSFLFSSHSGSSFKSKAISFAAGAAGGIAAYSLMRSMSGSYRSRPEGYYGAGYGGKRMNDGVLSSCKYIYIYSFRSRR